MIQPTWEAIIVDPSTAHAQLVLRATQGVCLAGALQQLHASNLLQAIGDARTQLLLAELHRGINGGAWYAAQPPRALPGAAAQALPGHAAGRAPAAEPAPPVPLARHDPPWWETRAADPAFAWLWAQIQLELLQKADEIRQAGLIERLLVERSQAQAIGDLESAGKLGHDTATGGFI